MSDDRDTEDTRENIARVALGYLALARKSGNSELTFDEAQIRVKHARRSGDSKREQGNR